MPLRHAALAVALALALPASAQGTSPDRSAAARLAEQRARDAETAAGIASSGKLLYDAEANKKTWGQYCADAQRLADQGEFRRAIRQASKALHLGETDRNPSAVAYAMRDLAYAYSLAGDLPKAQEWARKAIAAAKSISNPGVDTGNEILAPSYKVLGDVAARTGQLDEAVAHYEAALNAASFFSSQKNLIRLAGAAVDMRLGRHAKAREVLEKESRHSDPAVAGIALRALGDSALAEGDRQKAIGHFNRAAEASRAAKDDYAVVWAQFGLARAYRSAGDAAKANEALDLAIGLAEALRVQFRVIEFKTGFFGDLQSIFDYAVDTAAEAGNAAKALEFSERGRARAALDQIRGLASKGARPLAPAASLRSPVDVAAVLPERTVIVSYHLLPTRALAWTVRREGISFTALRERPAAVASSIRRWRNAITQLSPRADEEARNLHAILVEPLGLRDGERVIFVPHKSLHVAPLHALAGNDGPLIARHSVAYALSVAAAGETLASQASSAPGTLVLGNPDLGDPEMDLPAAETEAKLVAKILGGSARVRGEASARLFRSAAPGSGLIHVAAHATVDEVDPMQSSLKLAAGDVIARQIHELDLRSTRLVALSGCSSGLGTVSDGDEFWGFKRSFLVAGARSLLISLWPVSDDATARLMEAFYRHRQTMGAAEALQAAQRERFATKEDRATLFWAPFILVGDWR